MMRTISQESEKGEIDGLGKNEANGDAPKNPCSPNFKLNQPDVQCRLVVICAADLVLTGIGSLVSLLFLIWYPREAYLLIIIGIYFQYTAICVASQIYSCQLKKSQKKATHCLRFYRCHRFGVSVGSIICGVLFLLIAVIEVRIRVSQNKEVKFWSKPIDEPLFVFGFGIGGVALLQGIVMITTQRCFKKYLKMQIDDVYEKNKEISISINSNREDDRINNNRRLENDGNFTSNENANIPKGLKNSEQSNIKFNKQKNNLSIDE